MNGFKVIKEFELKIVEHQIIEVPDFVKNLSVRQINGKLFLYTIVEYSQRSSSVDRLHIHMLSNDQEVNEVDFEISRYIDTVVMQSGEVLHVFSSFL